MSVYALRWHTVPRSDLIWRELDGDLVVRNARSGSTHLLEPLAGEVLRVLAEASAGMSVPDLVARLRDEATAHEIRVVLRHRSRPVRIPAARVGGAGTALIVANLPQRELARRLAGAGLRLRTGPLVTEIRSRMPKVAQGIALHYADHPLEEPGGFADFHVRLAPPRNIRRWLQPQVLFQFDGAPPFLPLPADQAFPILEWGLNWCVRPTVTSTLSSMRQWSSGAAARSFFRLRPGRARARYVQAW